MAEGETSFIGIYRERALRERAVEIERRAGLIGHSLAIIGWVRGVRVEGDHMCVSLSVVGARLTPQIDASACDSSPSTRFSSAGLFHRERRPASSGVPTSTVRLRLIGAVAVLLPFNTPLSCLCHINENVLGLAHVR